MLNINIAWLDGSWAIVADEEVVLEMLEPRATKRDAERRLVRYLNDAQLQEWETRPQGREV